MYEYSVRLTGLVKKHTQNWEIVFRVYFHLDTFFNKVIFITLVECDND